MAHSDRFSFEMEYAPGEELVESYDWVRVSGGGLAVPILVRVAYGRDGRPIMTGLIIGDDGPAEITADTLRSIRVGALMEQLFEGFDPGGRPPADDFDAEVTWALMYDFTHRTPAPPPPERRQGRSRGPTDEELQHFAEVYRREIRRSPRRAMTATAESVGVSRATANRWAKLCREQGYLDREDDA
ncbi:hypothetical protein [Nocardiopsis rhodophaea]|uniref:hypothetical protein n=1 Tax=Nocardiopsis rhodophaea TaxID=280238 RepID=UPI0031DCCBB8